MLGDLSRSGFDIVKDHEDADAIVVNTCSFVEEAKTESLEVRGLLWPSDSSPLYAVQQPKLECTFSFVEAASQQLLLRYWHGQSPSLMQNQ